MDDERRSELRETHGKAHEAAEDLKAQAAEVLELVKRIEELTDGTPGWYTGMRTRVEARETLRQVRVLARALGHLGEGKRAYE